MTILLADGAPRLRARGRAAIGGRPALDTNTRSWSHADDDEHTFVPVPEAPLVTVDLRGSRATHRRGVRGSSLPRWRPDTAPCAPVADRRHLRPAGPAAGGCPARPDETAVLRARVAAARLRRRRLLLGTVAVGILVALALPWGGAGGHTLATPGPALAGATVSPHAVYVVQPGDTLWSIAQRLDPSADPRVVVAELESQIGTDTVQAGQRLHLP